MLDGENDVIVCEFNGCHLSSWNSRIPPTPLFIVVY